MVFGRCLDILRSNQQNPSKPPQVVPFRESKLTRLFQDYFIGNGRAVMIVNVSPSAASYAETRNVLHYASLAKEITTMSKLDTGLAPRSAKKRAPGEDDTILDASEKADLLGQITDLQEKLRHAEAMLLSMESEIRDEVANEMGDSLKAMEKEYEQRRQQELALMEDKYEKKIALLTKVDPSCYFSDLGTNLESLGPAVATWRLE